MAKIELVHAREILDSRGNPTVEVTVALTNGTVGVASSPSGSMTGNLESLELRDKDFSRYGGLGVTHAVEQINKTIAPRLYKRDPENQDELDGLLIDLDGTPNKAHFGSNSLTAISFAIAKASAAELKQPLYRYLRQRFMNLMAQEKRTGEITTLPRPMFNIINGGEHASNNLSFQEFMVVPVKLISMREMVRMGVEVDHALKRVLKKYKLSIAVGDEGGYAPDLDAEGFAPNINTDEEAIELIIEAIEMANYRYQKDLAIGLDIAASHFWHHANHEYKLSYEKQSFTGEQLMHYYLKLIKTYGLVYLEDGFVEKDGVYWRQLRNEKGKNLFVSGDDLVSSNIKQLETLATKEYLNTVVLKPNQIGTVSEMLEFAKLAKDEHVSLCVSHRSGETNDTYIADVAVALEAKLIKAGAPCRGERIAKYNRLMAIDDEVQLELAKMGKT